MIILFLFAVGVAFGIGYQCGDGVPPERSTTEEGDY